jgi:hypothetical protein
MRRRLLLASALAGIALNAPSALAQTEVEVSDERTDPLRTSTINDGTAGDLIITNTGRVTITGTGPAVTLDSDNRLEIAGRIDVDSEGDAVGVQINGGVTGEFILSGSINITDEDIATDDDDDGDVDGPLTTKNNRFGILVDGTDPFVGNIVAAAGSTITVIGNYSAALKVATMVDGDLLLNGGLSVAGEGSAALLIDAPISGDVEINGSANASGLDTSGIVVNGQIGGGLRIAGVVTSSGYRFASRLPEEFQRELDEDDRHEGGPAVNINASIDGGLYIGGPSDEDPGAPIGTISIRGSAPALLIGANAASGDIVLGEVVLPGVEDDPDTTDVDESADPQALGYGLVNRGSVTGVSELDGNSATGVRIEGENVDGTQYTVTVFGGFLNDGSLNATAVEATATALYIGAGAIVPEFANNGSVTATSFGLGSTARGVIIGAGGSLTSMNNVGAIIATGQDGASAFAISDFTGDLNSITNSGFIQARNEITQVTAGNESQPEGDVDIVAIDLSRNTTGATIRQIAPEVDENGVVVNIETAALTGIVGDIRLGSGDDQMLIEHGIVQGNIQFGDGADLLEVSGGATVQGALLDSDGDLTVNVADGTLEVTNRNAAEISEATFGDGSRLIFRVDPDGQFASRINASGTVTFESGSRVTASLANLVGDGADFIVLSANELVIQDAISELQNTDAPFLYNSNLSVDPNDPNQLVLSLSRKTADELGMHANQAAVYETAFNTWEGNADLGSAMAGITDQEGFFSAFDQLLPEYAASAIQFALASNDSAVGALSNRLEAVRRSPDETGGLWIQEFAYYADRAAGQFSPGYRGHGIGTAVGFDRPFGPFYAVGVNFVGAASEISESDGFDDPMSALTAQFGAYAGAEWEGVTLDLYAAAGIDDFETTRNIIIGNFSAASDAEWSGYHIAGAARLGREFALSDVLYVAPSVSVDYLRLYEDSYEESGGGMGVDLFVEERDSTSFSGTAAFTFGGVIDRGDSWWSPQMRLGYRSEFSGIDTETDVRYAGTDDIFTLRAEELPGSGFLFGLGLSAGSGYSTFSFAYDADFRDDFIRHTGRLIIRLVF